MDPAGERSVQDARQLGLSGATLAALFSPFWILYYYLVFNG